MNSTQSRNYSSFALSGIRGFFMDAFKEVTSAFGFDARESSNG